MGFYDMYGNYLDIPKEKVVGERATRDRILREAKIKGCYDEMILLFQKWDRVMNNCTNLQEREQMSIMGIMEISQLLDNGNVGVGGSLEVNGKTLIKG